MVATEDSMLPIRSGLLLLSRLRSRTWHQFTPNYPALTVPNVQRVVHPFPFVVTNVVAFDVPEAMVARLEGFVDLLN